MLWWSGTGKGVYKLEIEQAMVPLAVPVRITLQLDHYEEKSDKD